MRTILIGLVCLSLFIILHPEKTPIVRAQDYEPIFEPDLCPSRGNDLPVRCGYLFVPEDRNNPDGQWLRLAVMIVNSRTETPTADPILFLQGNPGMDAVGAAPPLIQQFYMPWLAEREIIILDQRGSGFSDPPMNCPEVELIYFERLGLRLAPEEDAALGLAAAARCHDRLVDQYGIHLENYNSLQSALDARDLRIALGIEQWNVYGLSFATKTAMLLMREDTDGIRSVILDAVQPPHVRAGIEGSINYGFRKFFEACTNDTTCNPNLLDDFVELVEKLNTEPVVIPVLHPLKNETTEFYLDGNTLVQEISSLIGQTGITETVPSLIAQLHQDEYTTFARIVSQNLILPLFFQEGTLFASECYEGAADGEPILVEDEVHPVITAAFAQPSISIFVDGVCDLWNVGQADASFYEPVTVDIPTLLVSGEFDNLTPPAWGQSAADYLPNGYFFEIPNVGHGTLKRDCPVAMATEFFSDPSHAPDTTCLAEMPRFIAGS